MWHRPQFARNRFSPSEREVAPPCTGCVEPGVEATAESVSAAETLEAVAFVCSWPAAHKTPPSVISDRQARKFRLNLNLRLRDPQEMQSGRSAQSSKCSYFPCR